MTTEEHTKELHLKHLREKRNMKRRIARMLKVKESQIIFE